MKDSTPVSWLRPKNDFIFKLLFGSNQESSQVLLIAFLNDVLNVPEGQSIVGVEILNPITNKQSITDKLVILDVKAKVIGYGFVNIEIQLTNQQNIHKRSLYYGAKLYEEQLSEGEDYRKLSRVASINLIDFQFFSTDNYRSTYKLLEENTYEAFPDLIQLHFFELTKFVVHEREGRINLNDRMVKWLCFLTNEDDSRWEVMAKKEPVISKAVEILKTASLDPETRMLYEAREKALKDMASIRGDGVREGRLEEKRQVARKMLEKGIVMEEIVELTGLKQSEVKEIKSQLKL